eukprot:SAG31_NODE_757_length_12296_cov_8.840289_7_plen_326_part_00
MEHAVTAAAAAKPAIGIGGIRLGSSTTLAERCRLIIERHVKPLPSANPQMLEMFRSQERNSPLLSYIQDKDHAWMPEFAGKWLTHAVQLWILTADSELRALIESFVSELASLQASNGYLGAEPDNFELKGPGFRAGDPWDSWGMYHIMTGLLMLHCACGHQQALMICTKIADLHVRLFAGDPHKIFNEKVQTTNYAIIDSIAWLYRLTRTPQYLSLCQTFLQSWEIPGCGDFMRRALAGKDYFDGPAPRWECLHAVMGLAEMYHATGESNYAQGLQNIWWSLCRLERHPQGALMSAEQAKGSPYASGSQETCCTVAWMCVARLLH